MSGAICNGTNIRYHVRIRRRGERRYSNVGAPVRTFYTAARRLAGRIAQDYQIDRGQVLMTADYYDPVIICEMRRP